MGRKAGPKPLTEVNLMKLQDLWFETKDQKHLSDMFLICVDYARSLCLKTNKGKIFIDPDRLYGIAVDSAVTFMKYYNNPDFKINASFAGLLQFKVLENLYGGWRKDEDQFASLNDIINTDNSTEVGDLQAKLGFESIWTPVVDNINIKENCVKEDLFYILSEFDEAIVNLRLSYIARLLLLLVIRTKSKRIEETKDLFFQRFNITFQDQKALNLLLLEIRKRLATTE